MRRKHMIWAVLALAAALAVLGLSTRKEDYTSDALAYLESQKPDPASLEVSLDHAMSFDGQSRVTGLEVSSDYTIDLLCSLVENAVQVRRVSGVPELNRPWVACGEQFRGSYEKLYYTYPDSRKIVEFTLDQAASMTLSLNITFCGPVYPEVRDYFVSELEDYLQALLPEDGGDQLEMLEDGYPDALNIRTRETLDWYLEYVWNSGIHDASDDICGPWAVAPRIQVGGMDLCNYDCADFVSPSTGRLLYFYFRQEDSDAIREYIEALAGWEEPVSG